MDNKTKELTGLSELIEMARADNVIKKSEYEYILNYAHKIGVDKPTLKLLLDDRPNRIKRKPGPGEVHHFRRLIQLMRIDGEIHTMEQGLLQILGLGMGFKPSTVKAMLAAALEHTDQATLGEELLKIHKSSG